MAAGCESVNGIQPLSMPTLIFPRIALELTGREREAHKIMAKDKHERNAIERSG
jgi:hypothetical protein